MLAPCAGAGLALWGCCQGLRGLPLGAWESFGVLAACVGLERLLGAQWDPLGVLAPCARYWGVPLESQGSPLGVLAPSARSWGVLWVFEEALWGHWRSVRDLGAQSGSLGVLACSPRVCGGPWGLGGTLVALQALGDT